MLVESIISGLGLLNLISLVSILLIGLPHGAFDGAIAAYLGYTGRSIHLISFLVLYISIATIVVALWISIPSISLIIFLGISIIHFGLRDAREQSGWFKWIQVVAHGGVVVIGISQSHKPEVNQIFHYLVGGEVSQVWAAINVGSLIVATAILFYAWRMLLDSRWRIGFLELMILLLLFTQLPPLVSFAIYFCCIHSIRHTYSIWNAVKTIYPQNILYIQAISYTIASWIIAGIAFWWSLAQMSAEASMMRVLFIGLAALTVPHMMLVDGFFRKKGKFH